MVLEDGDAFGVVLADKITTEQGTFFLGCGSVGDASPNEVEKQRTAGHNVWKVLLGSDVDDVIWETNDGGVAGQPTTQVNTTVYGLLGMLTVQGHTGLTIQHHSFRPAEPAVQDGVERYSVSSTKEAFWVCKRKRDATGEEPKSANWSQAGAYISMAKIPNQITKA